MVDEADDSLRDAWDNNGLRPTSATATVLHLRPGLLPEMVNFRPIDWTYEAALPPREWVYGFFLIKKFVSLLGSPGGIGKTAYAFAIALSVATGRPLLGHAVHEPGSVWICNLEDPFEELYRRFRAARLGHGLTAEDIGDRIGISSGRNESLIVSKINPQTGDVTTEPIVQRFIDELKRRDIKLVIIDPFVKSHQLNENSNPEIDHAMTLWAQVANDANCCVLLIHHFRKGSTNGEAASFRGASSGVDAARAAQTLTCASEVEAEELGIDPARSSYFLRVDNAKLNIAPRPTEAVWLQLVSVGLGNATELRREDEVQTVKRWQPPSALEGVDWPAILRILDRIEAGPSEGELWSANKQAGKRWVGIAVREELGLEDNKAGNKKAGAIVRLWSTAPSGTLPLLVAGKYNSPSQRGGETGCVRLDPGKVSEMRRQSEPLSNPDL